MTTKLPDVGDAAPTFTLSDAAGAVTENSFNVKRGPLRQFKFIPSGGGTVPTNLYDLTILDADNADVLVAAGANLSATVAAWVSPANPVYFEGGALTPTIANAGNAKAGTIVLIVGP